MLGFPILYLKGMRRVMFQLSGFYYRGSGLRSLTVRGLQAQVLGF